jgi:cytochrome b pre-mRNA-processing protein 3
MWQWFPMRDPRPMQVLWRYETLMFDWLRQRSFTSAIGRKLYDSIVARARVEPFYRDLGVPDSVEGRFELIVLHLYLVLERLRSEGAPGKRLSRALIETFVTDMDDSLREFGIGDMGVPRRVKRAAAAVYERSAAYAAAQQADAGALAKALLEHIYFGACSDSRLPERLAAYVRSTAAELARADSTSILGGNLPFSESVAFQP